MHAKNMGILGSIKCSYRASVCAAWISTNGDETFSWQNQAGKSLCHVRTRILALFEIHDSVEAPGFN